MKAYRVYKNIHLFIFLLSFSTLFAEIPDAQTTVEVQTIFGPLKLQDELLKIYNLEHMQRLKNLDQSGTLAYWNGVPKFNKLEYALEVLWLVQKFGGDLKEQIAALTHSISQTVFPEAADIFFGKLNYQDSIHEWFLQQTRIAEIIQGYDWVEKDICPENPSFKRIAQPFPDVGAIHIVYVLHTGLIYKINKKPIIKKKDVKFIIDSLRYEDGKWYFTNRRAAKKFATLSLIFTEHFWGSANNIVVYHITNKILMRASLLQRITKQDMNFGTDKKILDKLDACDDPKLKRLIAKAKIPSTSYHILEEGEGTPDFIPKIKFYGVDPWVFNKHSKKFKRLSELDEKFATEFKRVEAFCKKGYKIQLNIG